MDRFSPTTPAARYPIPMLSIVLRNIGNMGVEVTQVAVSSDARFSYATIKPHVGPACPFILAPHSSATYFVEMHEVVTAAQTFTEVMHASTNKIRSFVELGSGLEITGKWETVSPEAK